MPFFPDCFPLIISTRLSPLPGHFYLTNLLLDKLKSSAHSRVVTVSSDGHKLGKAHISDLQLKSGYNSLKAYGQSKTCNILFAVHLASMLKGKVR